MLTCNKCGYSDKGTGDFAHVCGPVEIKSPEFDQYEEFIAKEFQEFLLKDFWADPRFQFLNEIIKTLESNRIWGGMDWVYNPVHSYKYLPLLERARVEMQKLKTEYKLED
jgi:hypothetical protein